MKIVVIGSGAMGLAAALQALKAGHSVEVLEAAPVAGGMAAHFDFDGLSIERFYHFICNTDFATFQLLDELGIRDKLRWRPTSMGIFTNDRLQEWGNPIALLKFREISLFSRLRYGLFAFISVRRERWDAIENESARDWITRWCGDEVYQKLWHPLLALKFFQFADNVSAAWIWTRIKRIGRSRSSLMQEELGFLEGGSQTLVDALSDAIHQHGGHIRLGCAAQTVEVRDNAVTGVITPHGLHPADAVLCTVPTPLVAGLIPSLPEDWKQRYSSIPNMGVCCLIFKLKRSVTPHFWVNVSESDIAVPGIIEFSNLRSAGDESIVYVPYYMPNDHIKFTWTDQALLGEAFGYLQRLNANLTPADILASRVSRLRYAQPVCAPGFASRIPPLQTPIQGLQIADTCFYYPEDRGISESVRLGREMANNLSATA